VRLLPPRRAVRSATSGKRRGTSPSAAYSLLGHASRQSPPRRLLSTCRRFRTRGGLGDVLEWSGPCWRRTTASARIRHSAPVSRDRCSDRIPAALRGPPMPNVCLRTEAPVGDPPTRTTSGSAQSRRPARTARIIPFVMRPRRFRLWHWRQTAVRRRRRRTSAPGASAGESYGVLKVAASDHRSDAVA